MRRPKDHLTLRHMMARIAEEDGMPELARSLDRRPEPLREEMPWRERKERKESADNR